MRHKNYFFILLSILFLSCSNDDNDTASIIFETAILGVWEIEGIKENDEVIALTECFQKSTIEFKEDGAMQFRNYLNEGGKLFGECLLEVSDNTYNVTNNVIEIFYSDDGVNPNGIRDLFTILEVTDNNLLIIGIEAGKSFRNNYKKVQN